MTKARQRKQDGKGDCDGGAMVGATLALLAFLLAFMVSLAANFSSQRRQLVIEEANSISTTYLRADLLDEPDRTESRDLLREYVDLRLAALDPEKTMASILRSEEIHNILWSRAVQIARESPVNNINLYLISVNVLIDLHTERIIYGADIRIPAAVLLGVYIVAFFTMFLVGM
jgi:hypothetical protein